MNKSEYKNGIRRVLRILTLGTMMVCSGQGWGQTYDTVHLTVTDVLILKDSLVIPTKDTTIRIPVGTQYKVKPNQYARSHQFFDSLQSISYRNSFARELYKLMVSYKPPQEVFNKQGPVKSASFFKAFEGKIIRSVEVHRVDVIAGSVLDTSIHAESVLAKLANRSHTKTARYIIKNQVLFQIGDPVDPYQFAESERLIRSLSYIEDARIFVTLNVENLDYVDIFIVIKDRLPWNASLSAQSISNYKVTLGNRNLFGSGNQLKVVYLANSSGTKSRGFDLRFKSRNIRRSFVDINGHFANHYYLRGYGVGISRNFISTEIKFGGAAKMGKISRIRDLTFADSIIEEQSRSTLNYYEAWLGRSFRVGTGRNTTLSIRYRENYYIDRPSVMMDYNDRYHNRKLLLGGIYFSRIKFLKTKHILSFNITEDLPEGVVLGMVGGKDFTEFNEKWYLGGRYSNAKYLDFGYLLGTAEVGTFFKDQTHTNNVIQFEINYFTPLIKYYRSFNRTFFKLNYFKGRFLQIPYSQSLRAEDRVRDISGRRISGNQLLSGTIESVLFLPTYYYGFQFAPFVFSDLGYVFENRTEPSFSEMYTSLGGGIRIKNESLVLDTFEFRTACFIDKPIDGNRLLFEIAVSKPISFRKFIPGKPELAGFDY